jgi:hypothetical protein
VSSILPEHNTEHRSDQIHSEKIVGIGKKANSSDHDSSHVIPTEGRLVDFGESQSSPFIGVCYVRVVIVKVMEGSVASPSSASLLVTV